MKLLTKNSDYAIRALVHLAGREEKFISSNEIAIEEKIPLLYLRRILQTLIKSGLVDSREGVCGGVKLRYKPSEIDMARVITIFQGPIQLAECLEKKKVCLNRSTCILRKKIQVIEHKVAQEFKNITLDGLLENSEG